MDVATRAMKVATLARRVWREKLAGRRNVTPMRSGTRIAAAVGLGGWLISFGLSRLGVPDWVPWLSFAAGCGFLILAALWWYTDRQGPTDMAEAVEAARARQDHILTRLHFEYINATPEEEMSPEFRRSPTPALPKEWVENRLHEMGETWRRKEYRPPRQ
jgi:hypothetical protein